MAEQQKQGSDIIDFIGEETKGTNNQTGGGQKPVSTNRISEGRKNARIQKGMHFAYESELNRLGFEIRNICDGTQIYSSDISKCMMEHYEDYPRKIPDEKIGILRCNYCNEFLKVENIPLWVPQSFDNDILVLDTERPLCSFRCLMWYVYTHEFWFGMKGQMMELVFILARRGFGLKERSDFVIDKSHERVLHNQSHVKLYNLSGNHIYNDWVEFHQYTVFCKGMLCDDGKTPPLKCKPCSVAALMQYKPHEVKKIDEAEAMFQNISRMKKASYQEEYSNPFRHLPVEDELSYERITSIPDGYPCNLPKGTRCNYCHNEIVFDESSKIGIPIYKVEDYDELLKTVVFDYTYPFCSLRCRLTHIFSTVGVLRQRVKEWNWMIFAADAFFHVNPREIRVKDKGVLKIYCIHGLYETWGEYEARTQGIDCIVKRSPFQTFHKEISYVKNDQLTDYQVERAKMVKESLTPTTDHQHVYEETMRKFVEEKKQMQLESDMSLNNQQQNTDGTSRSLGARGNSIITGRGRGSHSDSRGGSQQAAHQSRIRKKFMSGVPSIGFQQLDPSLLQRRNTNPSQPHDNKRNNPTDDNMDIE